MALFGGKKKEESWPDEPIDIPRDMEEIKGTVTSPTNVRMSHVREPRESEQPVWKTTEEDFGSPLSEQFEPVVERKDLERPSYAPLFVKINRYRGIIQTLISIKNMMKVIANSFAIMRELDMLKDQTMSTVQSALNKIEKNLHEVDADLIRPTGLGVNAPPEEYQDVRNVEATVSDLKDQIRALKGELQKI